MQVFFFLVAVAVGGFLVLRRLKARYGAAYEFDYNYMAREQV